MTCWEVYHLPEFQALLTRLGIDTNRKIKGMIINLEEYDKEAQITVTTVEVVNGNSCLISNVYNPLVASHRPEALPEGNKEDCDGA